MAVWVVWLIMAVVMGVAETFTMTAVLGLLGSAALITAGAAAIGLPVPLQLLLFAAAATAGTILVRPIAARHMLRPRLELFGVDALPGRAAYVVDEVTDRAGVVRIGGEEWTARCLDPQASIPAGTAVDVILIDGVTAVVSPRE